MKKLLTLITTLSILITSIIPSFAAATTSTVSIKQFTQTLLTTLNISYTDPIQEAINQDWISKGHKLLSDVNTPITKEQSAQLIYGVLRVKEGVKPDLYYERILNYYVGDNNTIDPSYKRAVYTTIMNGFYEPQLISKSTKYFNPKHKLTDSEMKVMMIRLQDKSKRYDPFQYSEKTWTVDWDKSWGSYQILKTNVVYPKVSSVKKTMAFENGLPVQDKSQVIQELLNEEHNKYRMVFARYVRYEEYINYIPPAYQDYMDLEDSRELQIKEIQQWYQATLQFIKAYFNSSYKTLASDEKAIKMNMPSGNHIYNLIENHKKMIGLNKMVMTSNFVSDERTFYSFPDEYIRGRLYFKIESPKAVVPFVTNSHYYEDKIVNVKSGTWYYVDIDVKVVVSANDDKKSWSWEGNEKGVADYYMISDVYEITNCK